MGSCGLGLWCGIPVQSSPIFTYTPIFTKHNQDVFVNIIISLFVIGVFQVILLLLRLLILVIHFSLEAKHKEVSQEVKTFTNKIHMGQRRVVTLRKTVNEIESQISDLDAVKKIAIEGKGYERGRNVLCA